MNLGKLSVAAIALTLALSGCASSTPKASQSPTSSATESSLAAEGVVVTDETEIEEFKKAVLASCDRANKDGLIVDILSEGETIYRAPSKQEIGSPSGADQITRIGSKYQLGGWPSGDPLCGEALWVENINDHAKNDPSNEAGDYELRKVSEGDFQWSVHRGSPSFNPYGIQIKDGSVVQISTNNGFVYDISYGPVNAEIKQAYKKTLTASGYQYMYLGDQLWGMTLAKAQAFCKKNGLKLVVAEEDNVMLMPSGTQGGPFDPKRMNVNIMSGKIVGVWPG
jgi:hypothetical protein